MQCGRDERWFVVRLCEAVGVDEYVFVFLYVVELYVLVHEFGEFDRGEVFMGWDWCCFWWYGE